ncbi:hypothetical protein HRG_014062 [Hirsutella rhossiliensis]
MATPLKFKPYVPLPQRQRKKKHPDLAPKERRHDATLLETCGEGQYSQHNAEGLLKMNDQEVVMALDWSGHDWSDDMQFVSHPMDRCYASNAGGEEVDEHLGSALKPAAAQLAADNPQAISGSIVRVEDIQEGNSKATEKSPTLMDPAAPAAVMGPTVDVADDNLIQTALTWPKAGTAKHDYWGIAIMAVFTILPRSQSTMGFILKTRALDYWRLVASMAVTTTISMTIDRL